MTALPFLFVLVVRGRDAINGRFATVAAAALVVLFVAIDLHGTWVQMPTFFTGTADTTTQWSRLTAIHPSFLSGDRRWWFLSIHVGALCVVLLSVARASRHRAQGASILER